MRKTSVELPESIRRVVAKIRHDLDPQGIVLFGSRARGDHHENSDYDLAVKAPDLDQISWRRLLTEIDDEPITLRALDLVHFESMGLEYQREIDRDGILLP